MKVRVIAAASPRSNAVGTLDLECTPEGLATTYLGVGSYSEGYAPGALTHNRRIVVPWEKVKTARLDVDRLWVDISDEVTPHNRLMLMNFAESSEEPKVEVRRRQRFLWLGATTLACIVAFLVAGGAPGFSSRRGAVVALWLGAAVAAGMLTVALTTGGKLRLVTPEGAREQFFADLLYYLPTVARRGGPALAPTPPPRLQEALPRTTTGIVITLSACCLGAILTMAWLFRDQAESREKRAPVAEARPEPAPLVAPLPAALPAAPEPEAPEPRRPTPAAPAEPAEAAAAGSTCECARADSVLWRDPLPRLTALLIEEKSRAHQSHTHLELELALVNNSKAEARDISVRVQFYEQKPGEKREEATKSRALFYEGPLPGGHAIKWHVEARGTRFEVEGFEPGTLDPTGADTASADDFAELLNANHRPVRLHAAMMLAFLSDPRAKAGALALGDALRETEAPYLNRVLAAVSPVRVCDLRVSGGGTDFALDACVYNSGGEPLTGLGVLARALDSPVDHRSPVRFPPLVVADKTFPLAASFDARHGQRVSVNLDTTNADGLVAKEFELVADRTELLR